MAATADGGGYWLVASDGGIFAFGDAVVPRQHRQPGAEQAGRRDDAGPRGCRLLPRRLRRRHLLLRLGTVLRLARRRADQAPDRGGGATPTFSGYWFTESTGLVSNFGQASYYGSAPITLVQTHRRHGRGARDRDVRGRDLPVGLLRLRHQQLPVRHFPTADHAIGIVQVDGESVWSPRTRASPRRLPGRAAGSTSTPT